MCTGGIGWSLDMDQRLDVLGVSWSLDMDQRLDVLGFV